MPLKTLLHYVKKEELVRSLPQYSRRFDAPSHRPRPETHGKVSQSGHFAESRKIFFHRRIKPQDTPHLTLHACGTDKLSKSCKSNTPRIQNCSRGQIFCMLSNFVFGMCSICKTTTPCQCHIHVMSEVAFLEARCDTQTFKLVVMEKFNLLNNFVFGVCSICKTTTTCECHVLMQSHAFRREP